MADISEEILKRSKTVAIVGLSPNPDRPSYRVAEYLKSQGYRIVPVNPKIDFVLGERSYPNLELINEKIDVIDIFRRPEEVLPIVKSAIRLGIRTVWMQEGVVNEEAYKKAKEAGLDVVMDKCMLKEHQRLRKEGKL